MDHMFKRVSSLLVCLALSVGVFADAYTFEHSPNGERALEEHNAAKAVQGALEKAQQWKITPPGENGLHFLSKENLEVPGSEASSEAGWACRAGWTPKARHRSV